ncbi:methanethiol S-methyltransferase [Maricaulis salignorans]|uniref:methanethiol S-methyltransferase n=1 Tax=Maricaulis salignorans TaxID=144026 RepID=A0A1G9U0Q5_9PROT|nr:methanethiol S-methyltransferase [Maricaulis salignorans]SDM53115.1 Protein-S-isoprenylcysteine O-methyltransferase Ste14 [Maricaulis salignorans]
MARAFYFLFGVLSYVFFLIVFLYSIGFVGNMLVPKGIDDGAASTPLLMAAIINILLLSLFAVQHTVMARQPFKVWWTKIIPHQIERAVYVLLSSAALALIYWQWQPMTGTVWSTDSQMLQYALNGVFFLGWIIVLVSTFLISHFHLFGLKQTLAGDDKSSGEPSVLTQNLFYKLVRHPIMTGFIIAFWATPHMSVGHLLFAIVTTAYILVALQFEERDLIAEFGDQYHAYKQRVGMVFPLIGRSSKPK